MQCLYINESIQYVHLPISFQFHLQQQYVPFNIHHLSVNLALKTHIHSPLNQLRNTWNLVPSAPPCVTRQ